MGIRRRAYLAELDDWAAVRVICDAQPVAHFDRSVSEEHVQLVLACVSVQTVFVDVVVGHPGSVVRLAVGGG